MFESPYRLSTLSFIHIAPSLSLRATYRIFPMSLFYTKLLVVTKWVKGIFLVWLPVRKQMFICHRYEAPLRARWRYMIFLRQISVRQRSWKNYRLKQWIICFHGITIDQTDKFDKSAHIWRDESTIFFRNLKYSETIKQSNIRILNFEAKRKWQGQG